MTAPLFKPPSAPEKVPEPTWTAEHAEREAKFFGNVAASWMAIRDGRRRALLEAPLGTKAAYADAFVALAEMHVRHLLEMKRLSELLHRGETGEVVKYCRGTPQPIVHQGGGKR